VIWPARAPPPSLRRTRLAPLPGIGLPAAGFAHRLRHRLLRIGRFALRPRMDPLERPTAATAPASPPGSPVYLTIRAEPQIALHFPHAAASAPPRHVVRSGIHRSDQRLRIERLTRNSHTIKTVVTLARVPAAGERPVQQSSSAPSPGVPPSTLRSVPVPWMRPPVMVPVRTPAALSVSELTSGARSNERSLPVRATPHPVLQPLPGLPTTPERLGPGEVERLSEAVLRSIDRRVIAWRERLERS
jgi:hypothetical protein